MRIVILVVTVLFLAFVIYMLSNLVPASGALKKLEPLLVSQCQRVDVAPGTEDVTIDPELNLAFISAADRRAWFGGGTGQIAPSNGVYAMDLSTRAVRKVSNDAPADFLPHGISLWRGENGEKRLFVINHPSTGEEIVEIFDVGADGTLDHVEGVSFPEMHSPNDVHAVGPRAFYATNDRGYEGGIMGQIEAYLALPFASLVYFDGEKGGFAAKGLVYANGVNQSPDGSKLYVSEFLKRRVAVYERDAASGAVRKAGVFKVETGPDNIEVGADGALYIGGHTRVFEFLAHARDASKNAPSHVVKIDPATGASSDVFIATAGEINGSSVGAAGEGVLIVGAVFDGHVMVCPLGR